MVLSLFAVRWVVLPLDDLTGALNYIIWSVCQNLDVNSKNSTTKLIGFSTLSSRCQSDVLWRDKEVIIDSTRRPRPINFSLDESPSASRHIQLPNFFMQDRFFNNFNYILIAGCAVLESFCSNVTKTRTVTMRVATAS